MRMRVRTLVLGQVLRPLRPLIWLAAALLILLDAGIVYVTLRTAVEATAGAVGWAP